MAQGRTVNGVDVDQLMSTIQQVKHDPQIAQFRFRASNEWIDGTHNRAKVKDFYGAMAEDTSREELVFDIDEPPVLGGQNRGANPVEYLLVALSGCLTTSMVAHAAAKGIEIRRVESRYEGEIDLQGFLGVSDKVPVGYKTIRVYFSIDADISSDEKRELVRMGQKYSPVFNTITKGVAVDVQLDESQPGKSRSAA